MAVFLSRSPENHIKMSRNQHTLAKNRPFFCQGDSYGNSYDVKFMDQLFEKWGGSVIFVIKGVLCVSDEVQTRPYWKIWFLGLTNRFSNQNYNV